MLENKEIEAVVIATPDKFHAQAGFVRRRAGKHILCEKPLALTVADAQAALMRSPRPGVTCRSGSCAVTIPLTLRR